MRIFFVATAIAMTAALLTSCGKLSYHKTKSGLLYKIVRGDKGDSSIAPGSWVKLHFEQKLNDSVLQSSFGKMPAYARVMPGQNVDYSPLEVLPFLKVGDSAVVVLMIDSMVRKGVMPQLPENIKITDRIVYNFRVLEVFANDSLYRLDEERERALDAPRQEKEREEQMAKMRKELMEKRRQEEEEMEKSGEAAKGIKAMQDYLASAGINNAKMQGKGTFVVVDNPGTGEQARPGKYVKLNYVGSLIRNDSTFDKGTLERKLGEGELIAGMEEGLEAFRAGGKGVLYIPGFRAYGKSHPRFRPFEPMKFEIEVLQVSDTASQAPPMEER
ncbi:MAG: FKBP-type peptidyl-prolyl cis-trans isomerase [Chitinophagaceae bacterium]